MRSLRLFAWWCVGVAIAWVWMIPYARAETIVRGPANWSCYITTNQADGCAATCATFQNGEAYIVYDNALAVRCLGPTGGLQFTGNKNACISPQFHNSNAPGMCQENVPACVAPEVRQADGSCGTGCVQGEAGSASRYTGTFNSGRPNVTVGTYNPPPATLCDGQCVIGSLTTTNCSSGSAVGSPVQCDYAGTKTGATCSGGNGAAPTWDPCLGQGKVAGTVNGQPVCSGSAPTQTTDTKTTTTPTSTTTTTTTTSCTGDGSCTTTTTNQYTSGGSGANGTGPGSSTVPGTGPGTPGAGVGEEGENQTKGGFCQENPESPICKASEDECLQNPDRVGCGEYGTLPDAQPSTKAVPFNITAAAVPMNASCPASVALPYGATFSWQPICDGLGWIRPVILALAGLGAALIVVGGFQRG